MPRTLSIVLKPARAQHNIPSGQASYDVYLNGVFFDQLYYNLRGYRGYLPTPEGKSLDIGEKSLSAYKKEIANLNREFAAHPQGSSITATALGRKAAS